MKLQGNAPVLRGMLRIAILLCAVNWFAASSPLRAQGGPTAQSATPGRILGYEVASFRPDQTGSHNGVFEYRADGLDFVNLPLRSLVEDTYNIFAPEQISGLPGWVNSESYDVQARVDVVTAEAWKTFSLKQLAAQQRPMVRLLLADRCQLRAHIETRKLPVYDLVIGKSGLKMKEAQANEEPGGMISDGEVEVHSTAMDLLVSNLSSWSGRMVVDKTGLGDKRFDFDMKWTPDNRRDADPANAGPSIFAALEEQLGLKLLPSKAPVQVLVIDHIERPSQN